MAPLVTFSVLLSVFYAISSHSIVSGDCPFPDTYMNRFWFRMYASSDLQVYTYRQYRTSAVIDNRNDVTTIQQSYPCWNISFDATDAKSLYYLVDNYGRPTCAKSVITNDSSAILLQEAFVSNAYSDASQCRSLFTANCSTCDSLWMPVVNQLTQPPPFGSSSCPLRGLFQLTASLAGSSSECSGDFQSTAMFSDSTVQMNLCSQGTLRNTTFKSKTLLQDSLTCMASLGGSALNSDETGSTILLLRDDNVLYCARLKNSSGVIELSINVKSTSYYAGCSFAANTTSVLQLFLRPITYTPGLPTTFTTFTTLLPTTSLPQTMKVTPVPSTTLPTTSTTTTTIASTTTTTTTTTSTPAITTPTTPTTTTTSTTTRSPTFPSTTIQVTPGQSSLTPGAVRTTKITSKSPPENIEGPIDNCPSTACATGAVCNEATHTCSCQALFYTYSNSSSCVQDDRAIDDTFLKIVVPIIAITAAASLIAALVLCFATRPLDATLAESTGAALAAASTDNGLGVSVVQPATQLAEKPVFVSYGRNDTYANVDTIDRNLVSYGDQLAGTLPAPPNNFVMVNSSIPAKM